MAFIILGLVLLSATTRSAAAVTAAVPAPFIPVDLFATLGGGPRPESRSTDAAASGAADEPVTMAALQAQLAATNARLDALTAQLASLSSLVLGSGLGGGGSLGGARQYQPEAQGRRRAEGEGDAFANVGLGGFNATVVTRSTVDTCHLIARCDLRVDGIITYQGQRLAVGFPSFPPSPAPTPQPTMHPTMHLSVEVLVVAGGGGNAVSQGQNREAGSGAGGLLYSTGVSLAHARAYAVTVGAGGTGRASGGNSYFAGGSMTAYGGGSGGNYDGCPGTAGGSGGGNWYYVSGGGVAAGVTGQGNSGAACSDGLGGGWCGGGGGGAGGPASAAVGGPGRVLAITGSSVTYARGGDADCYSGINADASGAAGTGNGASGAGNGGSGVVVIAYPGSSPRATGGSVSTSARAGYVVHIFTSGGTFTSF